MASRFMAGSLMTKRDVAITATQPTSSQLGSNAAVAGFHVMSVTQVARIMMRLLGQLKNTMSEQSFAAFAVISYR